MSNIDTETIFGSREITDFLTMERVESEDLNRKMVGVVTRVVGHNGAWGCIALEVEPQIIVEGFISPLQVPVLVGSEQHQRLEALNPGTELYILAQISLHSSNNGSSGRVGYEPLTVFCVLPDGQLERIWGNLDAENAFVQLVVDRRGVAANGNGKGM